mgnify:CR=1 FL=1
MAIILYSNGLTEEILPQGLTFSDEDILGFFKTFNNIQTKRLDEVPNTWCVWGELKNPAEDDYNKLASEVIQEHCYSQIFFLHDTEVDPSWNLTDAVIYDNYLIFKKKILKFLDEIAIETIREIEQIREETGKTNKVYKLVFKDNKIKIFGNEKKFKDFDIVTKSVHIPLITDFFKISFEVNKNFEVKYVEQERSKEYAENKLFINLYETNPKFTSIIVPQIKSYLK